MDRVEVGGLGVAVAGHAALLAALTFGFAIAGNPPPLQPAMEVSFVEEVALASAAPAPSTEPAAASARMADPGPVQDAVPTPAPSAAPTPERPRPRPTSPPKPGLPGMNPEDFGPAPNSRPNRAPAARMSAAAAADIGSAIARQVQPCADRQIYPGPGAERIVTPIVLRINRNGSLNGRPQVGRQRGLDDENRRYAQRVADIAIAAFLGCSPLRGLPQELYDVPGGWSSFTLNYRLPG